MNKLLFILITLATSNAYCTLQEPICNFAESPYHKYYINGGQVSRQEYIKYMEEQRKKPFFLK